MRKAPGSNPGASKYFFCSSSFCEFFKHWINYNDNFRHLKIVKRLFVHFTSLTHDLGGFDESALAQQPSAINLTQTLLIGDLWRSQKLVLGVQIYIFA